MERRIAPMKEEPGRRRAEDEDGGAEDAIAEIIDVDIEMADNDGSDNDDVEGEDADSEMPRTPSPIPLRGRDN